MLNKLDMVPQDERAKKVKEFVRRLRWRGPVFEISALTREGCDELCMAVYEHLHALREAERRQEDNAQLQDEVRDIASIDPDDPRFKNID